MFSFISKAELIFENEFPKTSRYMSLDMPNFKFMIGKIKSLIDEDYVGLNISKTSDVEDWTAYKWVN